MDHSIKEVFEDECKALEIGPKLLQALSRYQLGFVNKNPEHIAFFGGNLTGVNIVRFTPQDSNVWFEEVLQADEYSLEQRLLALPTVNENFHVSSDTLNLSCVWLAHAIWASPKLSKEQKHQGMVDTLLVLNYKFFTSRYVRHFKYPADRGVAEANYATMSRKFAIKQQGTWSGVFHERVEDLLSATSIHKNAIEKMNRDSEVIYMLNDSQGRIRAMLKNIYDSHLNVMKQGIKITTTSSVIEHDGESILRDKTGSLISYTRYMHSVITDKHSFIRDELARVIEKLMPTTPPQLFRKTLEWMSDNYGQKRSQEIAEIVDEALVHSFGYFNEDNSFVRDKTDLSGLLARLKGVYGSSRSTDPTLLALREKMEKIVKEATFNRNSSLISSVRTAVLLYLVARALTMKHYSAAIA